MEPGAPQQSILRFLNTGAQINAIRQGKVSLKSVASGIQCYASFCDLHKADNFPPSAETVLRRSTLFAPGKTFAQYIDHLPKARQIVNLPNSRSTPTARVVSKGLANAQDMSCRFGNFIQRELFFRLIRFETLKTDVVGLFYSPYLLLRVPSKGLPIFRAAVSDIPTTKAPQEVQSLMGCRTIGDPSLNFETQADETGEIMMRPCFCGDDGPGHMPPGMGPNHDFWPHIQRSYLPRGRLFVSLA